MTPFADHYRDIVLPRLRGMCAVHGLYIEMGAEDFAEGYGAVFGIAWRLGASRLPGDKLQALEEWIATRLLAEADAAATAVQASREVSDRVARDIEHWERQYAQQERELVG